MQCLLYSNPRTDSRKGPHLSTVRASLAQGYLRPLHATWMAGTYVKYGTACSSTPRKAGPQLCLNCFPNCCAKHCQQSGTKEHFSLYLDVKCPISNPMWTEMSGICSIVCVQVSSKCQWEWILRSCDPSVSLIMTTPVWHVVIAFWGIWSRLCVVKDISNLI